MYKPLLTVLCAVLLTGCGGGRQGASEPEEDKAAKTMLQGIWLDDDTETAVMRIAGDTIHYVDVSSTAPVSFKVVGDSLITYGARRNAYQIVKQGEYVLWFSTETGNEIHLHKAENALDSLAYVHVEEVPVYDEVIQKDSVVVFDNVRYRGYVYINPSRIRVMRPRMTDDGIGIDDVYYDNIIHICVYEGKNSLFAKDIKKQMLQGTVPDEFLQWAILSDMDFMGVDARGYRYQATVCIPDDATCYLVNLTINQQGEITYEIAE